MFAIIKYRDGGVRIVGPLDSKFGPGKRPYEDCKLIKEAIGQGLDWFLIDKKPDKSQLESRKQLMHDGDRVVVDTHWEHRLMPDHLIKRKALAKCEADLDAALSVATPDAVTVARCQRDVEKLKREPADNGNSNKRLAQIALDGLDARVAGGESDKPSIRLQLQRLVRV